jgi:O-methyltransferase
MTVAHAVARRVLPVEFFLRRHPLRSELQPERLEVLLETLRDLRAVPGAILEVGCFRGGTTVEACRVLRELGVERDYVCVDTFAGFVPDQFEEDEHLGTSSALEQGFARNPIVLVRRTLRWAGFGHVRLVQGDIATVPDEQLPAKVATCLLDVDLAVPTYEGLKRILPRLAEGGKILVDDCDEGTNWRGARVGYTRFVAEQGLPEKYVAGFGVVSG